MSSVFLCFFLYFISLLIHSSSISTTINTTTLTLTPIPTPKHTSNPWEHITSLTKSTLYRAHHLKNPTKTPTPTFQGISTSPLNARSYGGYSLSLSFGTPPQHIPLVFDTGSSLLWVPCTSHYSCSNCTFSGIDPSTISTFKPKMSSTVRVVGCRSPKCGLLFGSDVHARCPDCPDIKNCTQPCPNYFLQYGSGATAGLAITDSLDLPGRVIPGFFFGCSVISSRQPQGIAGFGRAPSSVPNQLKLSKYSYCLLSHKFDDKPKSSDLILTGKDQNTPKLPKLTYTSFVKNPNSSPYDEYYYVSLRKITVANKRVKLPYKYLVPNPNGNGGVIVDSGTTLTFMDQPIFDPLVKEIAAQTRHLKRARDVEAQTGFGLCYNVSNSSDDGHAEYLPGLALHFKGGAKMELSLDNYFIFIDSGSLCLTIVTGSSPAGPSVPVGPAMIIGNYMQQNFYIEYDLVNQKFGFKKHKCG